MKGKLFVPRRLTMMLFSLLVILVSALQAEDHSSSNVTPVDIQDADTLRQATNLSVAFRSASETIRPAVVSIRADQQAYFRMLSAKPILSDQWQRYLGYALSQVDTLHQTRGVVVGPQPVPQQSGTGVIVSPEGYVLTSCDVVAGANQFLVKTHTNIEYPAKVARKDTKVGLALLKIDAPQPDMPVARLADFDETRIGDWVLAIGGPAGTTVSAGIVSAISKDVGKGADQSTSLHTDALISPVNQGGPLVNLRGEVVGINIFKATRRTESREFGVAVPSNLAQRMLDSLVPVRAIASRRSSVDRSWSAKMMDLINQAGNSKNSIVAGRGIVEWPGHVRELASRIKTLVTESLKKVARHKSSSVVQPEEGPAQTGVRFSPEFSQNRSAEKLTNTN